MVMWKRDSSLDSSPCGLREAGALSSGDGLVLVAIHFLEQVPGGLLTAGRGMLNYSARPKGQADDAGHGRPDHDTPYDDFYCTTHGSGFIRDIDPKSKGVFNTAGLSQALNIPQTDSRSLSGALCSKDSDLNAGTYGRYLLPESH